MVISDNTHLWRVVVVGRAPRVLANRGQPTGVPSFHVNLRVDAAPKDHAGHGAEVSGKNDGLD